MVSGDLEVKEEDCYEMDSRDEQWGSFRVPARAHVAQAGLGSAWSQGPFWP